MNMQEELKFDEFPITSYEQWKDEAIKSLKGGDFEKKLFTKTIEDIILKPIYNENDLKNNPLYNFQYPGIAPYNRGENPLGYKANPWLIAQAIPYPDIKQFNTALQNDLANGQNAINIKVRGISNHHRQIKYGIELNNIDDFANAFENIDLSKYPIYFSTDEIFYDFSKLFQDFLKKSKIDISKFEGNLGADIFGKLLSTGNLALSLNNYYKQIEELINQYDNSNFGVININGSIFHNAGANTVQELAYSFTEAIEYIKTLQLLDLDVDKIAPKIRFSFGIGSNFFMEIAKLRAARIIWTKIIREFGGNEQSQKMFIHSQTSLRNKTKFNPWSNIMRNSTECLAAILGNSNSIEVGYFDSAYGYPSELSRRLARNTQLIYLNESHLLDTIDPAAGSYYLEELTNEICIKTWQKIQEIEANGGFFENIKSGNIQTEIQQTSDIQIKDYHTRKLVLVGTNKYPLLNEKIPEGYMEFESNEEAPSEQNNELNIEQLRVLRFAEDFEKLRDNANAYKEKNGAYPSITLFNFGELSEYKPRNDFAGEYLAIGGFEIKSTPAFSTPSDAMKYLLENPSNIITICSSDEKYVKIVPEFAQLVKKFKPLTYIILAGYPKEQIDLYKQFGVDDFIYLNSDVYETLLRIQNINLIK
ncbi:MAG: acyl-CoA mutase large subunit family protein [Candidatus Kapabacteria bacterium]|nr:acyl-CoA mutase large subunit family protein [Candidatus Kapabacteria bacterium]